MSLSFIVGESEKHAVTFNFDKIFGFLKITVDDEPVIRDLRFMSFRLTKEYRFVVGDVERHEVVIQKSRRAVFAGFRAQEVVAYVDGEEVARGVA